MPIDKNRPCHNVTKLDALEIIKLSCDFIMNNFVAKYEYLTLFNKKIQVFNA